MTAITTKVVLGIVETKHPASGKIIGKRMVASVPNRARYDVFSGEYVQSHAPCYRVIESGDYGVLSPERIAQWMDTVSKWHKIRF